MLEHAGQLYIFAERGQNEIYLNDMWQYRILEQKWEHTTFVAHAGESEVVVPEGRINPAGVVYEQTFFFFGGRVENGSAMNDL